MTALLKEVTNNSQTVVYQPPRFKARALLGYGFNTTTHGKETGARSGANLGFTNEAGDCIVGAVDYQNSAVGSLDLGHGGFHPPPGTDFYLEGGGSIPIGRLESSFACGQLDLVSTFTATSAYLGLIIIGGQTFEASVGYTQFTGLGSVAVTGVGFQPDLLLTSAPGHAFTGGMPNTPGPYGFTFGAADGAGNQFAHSVGGRYLTSTSGRNSLSVNDACFLQTKPGFTNGSLTSMDSDGFTVNVTTWAGTNDYFWWIALADPGGNFKVGTMVEGDATITPGFTPDVVMFACSGNTVYGAAQPGAGISMGAASGVGNEFAGWASAPVGAGPARYWTTKALAWILHPIGGGIVSAAEATVTSWGSSIGLSWPTVSANGLKGGWVAMRTSQGPGYDGCGANPQQFYRWLKK